MPFGLACAPGFLTMLVQECLTSLLNTVCTCYMDDCLVFARTRQECLERTDLVIERLAACGVSLKASKCVFMARSVTFLGFHLSAEGLSPDKEKVAAIRKIDGKSINSLTAVRSFLGAAGFWRRHIKGFAELSRPLCELTKANVNVPVESQKEPAQRAIELIKERLTTAPVLAHPDFSKEMILQTDASVYGLGAVLSQADSRGRERPLGYWGRTTTPAERKYTVSELELLAVLGAIKNWRAWLYSPSQRPFQLRVDHSALLYLHTAKEVSAGGPAARLHRWFLKLSEMSMRVVHTPGKLHFTPDFISRMQHDPEYQRLTDAPETLPRPQWATVSDESIKIHRQFVKDQAALEKKKMHTSGDHPASPNKENSNEPEVPHPSSPAHIPRDAHPPTHTMSGDINIKVGGEKGNAGKENKSSENKFEEDQLIPPETARMMCSENPSTHPRLRCLENTVATATSNDTPTDDLSLSEEEDLIYAISTTPPASHTSPALDAVEATLKGGRKIALCTFEAVLKRLNELNMGRRAVELIEIMLKYNLSSKRAIYYALSAAHRAGLHLQSAPLMRTLATNHAITGNNTRKTVQRLSLEFDTQESTNNRRPYHGYVRSLQPLS